MPSTSFFHAFSGSDMTSFFFNQGKCKFWDRWDEFSLKDELTSVFSNLSDLPDTISEGQLTILEKLFVLFILALNSKRPLTSCDLITLNILLTIICA